MSTTGNPTDGVITEAWGLYKAHFGHLVGIAFVVYLAVALVTFVLVLIAGLVGAIIAALAAIVALFWAQGALVKAIEDIRDGRADLSMGETFRAVSPKLGTIAGASILAGIGIAIGFVLLIVPGLILLTLWVLIVPVIVLENASVFDSFRRSQQLVRGRGMQVFGVIVVTILVLLAFGLVLGLVLQPVDADIRNVISNLVSGTLTAPFTALAWTILYFRLREVGGPADAA